MYKLFTHNDLDGVACAVLAKLAYKDDIEIEYCGSPAEVTKRLNECIWKEYNQIFVTDCSFFPDKINQKKMFSNIKMFDHHPTAVEVFKDYTGYKVIKTEHECGATLWHYYLVNKGLIEERPVFVELVRAYDTWDWALGNDKMAYYLSNLVFSMGIKDFVISFTEKLKHNDIDYLNIFDYKERVILEYMEKQKSIRIKKAVNNAIRVLDKYAVTYSSVDPSMLGNVMCDELKVDIAFVVNMETNRISARTNKDDVNVGELMKKLFNGGGHAKAGGAMITDCIVSPLVLIESRLKEWGN